jgi:hypothetical protein
MERIVAPNEVGVSMPIKTVVIMLDEIGYAGWQAELRLNVRARTYDDFLSQDRDQFWAAFTEIVRD